MMIGIAGALCISGVPGFAAGVLPGTNGSAMLPNALEPRSLAAAIGGFVAGFAYVYAFF